MHVSPGLGRNPPSWEFWCLLPPHAFVFGFVEGSSSSSSSWHCIVRVFFHNSCKWFPRIFQMNSGRGKLFCKDHKSVALVQDLIAISKHPEILGFTVSYLMSPIQDQLSKSVMGFFFFCIDLSQLWFAILYIYQTLWFCKGRKVTFLQAEQFVLPDNLRF